MPSLHQSRGRVDAASSVRRGALDVYRAGSRAAAQNKNDLSELNGTGGGGIEAGCAVLQLEQKQEEEASTPAGPAQALMVLAPKPSAPTWTARWPICVVHPKGEPSRRSPQTGNHGKADRAARRRPTEVDMTRIVALREKVKAAFVEREGAPEPPAVHRAAPAHRCAQDSPNINASQQPKHAKED